MEEDLKFDLFDNEIVVGKNGRGESINECKLDIFAYNLFNHSHGLILFLHAA
ncbi:hypothetical protein HanXRQr2_Chr15g0672931 [Helianthus annuus]|uniref:Uncharacterized protein n=1 Tax=Helianthus annuus TaxID=4232 RepID=A0A9K3DY57_HELAN|nr:hypothetical protein HanXRQr2_Chr15g0672931 [Helianthus annuus]KAJ0829615.1 hypothetical protein HanPSC8_Chr15g0645851 [Helianthus annuus]